MNKLILCFLLLAAPALFSQDWKTNMEEAKQIAAAESKTIILVFSGSDWCAPCIKLDKNIWSSEQFLAEAKTNWVLVKADFPKKKSAALSDDVKKSNAALAELYNKEGFFPLVVVLDANGKVLGKTGYKDLKPDEYIALLHNFEKKK